MGVVRGMASVCAAWPITDYDAPLPRFDEVRAEDVVPAMRALLGELEGELMQLEAQCGPSWDALVPALERIEDRLGVAWGTVGHIKAVKDSDALRAAYEEVNPEVVKFGLRMSQSEPIYLAFKGMREDAKGWEGLNTAQKRIVERAILDAELAGIALKGEAKDRFNAIKQELSKLSTAFSNHVLDATKAYSLVVKSKDDVTGIPASALQFAAQQAVAKEGMSDATAEGGPWVFTLDIPSYLPFMQHCPNRGLREQMFKAYLSRASSGETDNSPVIERVLELRAELATLLGHANFAEVSLSSKMATLPEARRLLSEVRDAAKEGAIRDLSDILMFMAAEGATETQVENLAEWDMTYWAERLKTAAYGFSEEELRPYFPLPQVLDGMFRVARELFDVDIAAADGEAPVWHPDVRFFKVKDVQTGEPIAAFYLDPYSRPAEKRGGAWMNEVLGRSNRLGPGAKDGKDRLPVAHMVCNQQPPLGDKPSCMTFREVETLFHEFGHNLQHILTRQSESMCSGIRGVEWDAVELPSQFMENWVYHEPTLMGMARHVDTGEQLPKELYQKICDAKNFRAGSQYLRQVHFAMTDLALHSEYVPGQGGSVFAFERELSARESTKIIEPWEGDRFLCGFSHIFAGGYSAGYYSYLYAEVLSSDAWGAFVEAGEESRVETGKRFRDTVLALGGGVAPAEVFRAFRGREPSSKPLLEQRGLIPASA